MHAQGDKGACNAAAYVDNIAEFIIHIKTASKYSIVLHANYGNAEQ